MLHPYIGRQNLIFEILQRCYKLESIVGKQIHYIVTASKLLLALNDMLDCNRVL